MKAVRIHGYGGPEVVRVEEIPVPVPGPGQLLVKVAAAGVNPVDWKIRNGGLSANLPIPFPYTLGCDFSGTVEAVGPGTSRYIAGDAVYGYPSLLRSGAYAEYIVAEELECAPAPTSIPLAHAAAVPVAAITACEGLFVHGKLQAGETVLILGGAGGVGSMAVQFARQNGAMVYATASTRNQQYLRELGATPIDYTTTRPADVVTAELVFDLVGGSVRPDSFHALKPGGRYVTPVHPVPTAQQLAPWQATGAAYGIQPSSEELAEIAARIDRGHLHIEVETTFPLERVGEALALSEAGRTRGKILLIP